MRSTDSYNYKGEVRRLTELPAAENSIGDVYQVLENENLFRWTGEMWTQIRDLQTVNNIKSNRSNTMEKLSTIQKRNNLNNVYRTGDPGPGGAYHDYDIYPASADPLTEEVALACIEFQKGARNVPESRRGVLDGDLLEIVRDRLKSFQEGPYATRENEMALMHIEEALMWMEKRANDRAERGVLGTMKL